MEVALPLRLIQLKHMIKSSCKKILILTIVVLLLPIVDEIITFIGWSESKLLTKQLAFSEQIFAEAVLDKNELSQYPENAVLYTKCFSIEIGSFAETIKYDTKTDADRKDCSTGRFIVKFENMAFEILIRNGNAEGVTKPGPQSLSYAFEQGDDSRGTFFIERIVPTYSDFGFATSAKMLVLKRNSKNKQLITISYYNAEVFGKEFEAKIISSLKTLNVASKIVNADKLLIRSKASRDSDVLGYVEQGEGFVFLEDSGVIETITTLSGRWIRIKNGDGIVGYVFDAYIGSINN